eukprot:2159104-Prymnesium_polylepis.1
MLAMPNWSRHARNRLESLEAASAPCGMRLQRDALQEDKRFQTIAAPVVMPISRRVGDRPAICEAGRYPQRDRLAALIQGELRVVAEVGIRQPLEAWEQVGQKRLAQLRQLMHR